jgi:hypothetical protein
VTADDWSILLVDCINDINWGLQRTMDFATDVLALARLGCDLGNESLGFRIGLPAAVAVLAEPVVPRKQSEGHEAAKEGCSDRRNSHGKKVLDVYFVIADQVQLGIHLAVGAEHGQEIFDVHLACVRRGASTAGGPVLDRYGTAGGMMAE